MTAPRNEQKYFMLKLIHSGRTLREAKALMYAVATGLHPEYTASGDLKDLSELEGGLSRIGAMTRIDAKKLSYRRLFKPRKTVATREETLAKFATRWKGGIPLSWKRYGNLVRKGRPNKPRPGSSRGKIGKTKVIGVKSVLNDFKFLIRTLSDLGRDRGKGNLSAMRKAYKSVRTSVNTSIANAGK